MSYYIILGVATALFLLLGGAIWFRTRCLAFLLGLLFIYYWTLWGGWFIVYDLRGGNSGMQYSYFYYKLFPVHLDADYLSTLILFSVFVVVVEVTVLFCTRGSVAQTPVRPIRIFHNKMLLIAFVSGLVSFLIVKNSIGVAPSLGFSAYQYVRVDPSISRFFTLHQVLNRICLFTTMMGLAVCLSGPAAKYIVGQRNPRYKVLYLLVLAALFLMNLSLGDRHDLVANFFVGVFFYLANATKPHKMALALSCLVAFFAVGAVGLTRGVSVVDTLRNFRISETAASSIATYVKSNEPFAAHMSMYGSLHKHVELTYGSSFVSLLVSVVPRAIWLDRPADIYVYYSTQVGAVEGQGYTIHHATGWYLNFGTAGVVLGAVLFGWVWGSRWKKFQQIAGARSYWTQILRVIAFWTFTASVSVMLRSGPEGYKTVLLEEFLIPTLILGFAGSKLVLRWNRPTWVFGEKPVVGEVGSGVVV